ncbi:MAG TPA: cytosine permease, partial [Edaphobacter sp.]
LLRHKKLDVDALYRSNGVYSYSRGINPRAIVALTAGVLSALAGIVLNRLGVGGGWVDALVHLYDYAWFVGFFVAGTVYLILMRGRTPPIE